MAKTVSLQRLEELASNVEPCQCDECLSMCRGRPCWPTPDEALNLIERGYAAKMMLDCWDGDDFISVVCPAIEGLERKQSYSLPFGPCVLQKWNGDCLINANKPVEGRLARHDVNHQCDVHKSVAQLWNTREGRAVVELWKEVIGIK